jgi:sulfonate transport system substrate-binding protein
MSVFCNHRVGYSLQAMLFDDICVLVHTDLFKISGMKQVKVKIEGVPEHYNLPWQIAVERGLFAAMGIDLVWSENKSGTGAMCQNLRSGKSDLAILLTEGAVLDINKGNKSKICSFFIQSPLIWGVHASGQNTAPKEDFASSRFAISRFTSGSHLMAFVYGNNFGRELEKSDFEIVNHMEGARLAMKEDDSLLFMWEKYMTKHLVDSGEFRLIDECPTPWPAFVVVASDEFIATNKEVVNQILAIVQLQAKELKEDESTIDLLVHRYNLSLEDAKEWFSSVEWSPTSSVDETELENVSKTLKSLGLLDECMDPEDLCSSNQIPRGIWSNLDSKA